MLDHHGAESQHGVEGDDVLRAVRQHEGDPISPADPEAAQALGRSGHLVTELGVGRLSAEELQCGSLGVLRHGRVEQVRQRFGDRLDVVRHPLGVAAQPDPFHCLGHDSLPSPATLRHLPLR